MNGGWGVDFSSPELTKSELRDCLSAWLDSGLAAFLPTLVSSTHETYQRNLPLFASVMAEPAFHGRVLGLHLEGPFIADDTRVLGAHRRAHIWTPRPDHLDWLRDLAAGTIRMITVAVEPPGAEALARHACGLGITVAIGHSYYSTRDLDRMRAAGATALTHVGNALPPRLDRHANPLLAALAADSLTAMFIADGHHLPPDLLRLLFRTRPIERLVAVSDASPAFGLPAGTYELLGQRVEVTDERAVRNLAENHLVGAATSLLTCLDRLIAGAYCYPPDCAAMASENPLSLLGLSRRGLATGVPEVVFDEGAGVLTIANSRRSQ